MTSHGRPVAVVVLGDAQLTRVTRPQPLSQATLDSFARQVGDKAPGRTYFVVDMSDTARGWKRTRGHDPLYVWWVGEGFSHDQGWWIRYGEDG